MLEVGMRVDEGALDVLQTNVSLFHRPGEGRSEEQQKGLKWVKWKGEEEGIKWDERKRLNGRDERKGQMGGMRGRG